MLISGRVAASPLRLQMDRASSLEGGWVIGYTARMPQIVTTSEREDALRASLRKLCLVLERVQCCAVVGEDGLPIAAYPAEKADASAELAALSASLTGLGQRALDRLAQGERGRLVLEGEKGALLSLPVRGATLAVLVESGANLAQALFASQKAADEIGAAL